MYLTPLILLKLRIQYPKFNTSDAIEFELDDYHLERLKELGLHDSSEPDDGSEFVSRL
jgi:hypothetical protein